MHGDEQDSDDDDDYDDDMAEEEEEQEVEEGDTSDDEDLESQRNEQIPFKCFKRWLDLRGLSAVHEEAEALMASLDTNNDSMLSFDELHVLMSASGEELTSMKKAKDEERLWQNEMLAHGHTNWSTGKVKPHKKIT